VHPDITLEELRTKFVEAGVIRQTPAEEKKDLVFECLIHLFKFDPFSKPIEEIVKPGSTYESYDSRLEDISFANWINAPFF
jgi:hypothetical protein